MSRAVGWDVIPFQITVHNGEKHLKEQVDGVDQHRQQEQPCFARHHDFGLGGYKLEICRLRKKRKKKQKFFWSVRRLQLVKLRHKLRIPAQIGQGWRGVQEGGGAA
jgi:hypothetical protein